MEKFKCVLKSLNKKTFITLFALITILSAMFFGGANLLGQGKKGAQINTPEISTKVDDKVSAATKTVQWEGKTGWSTLTVIITYDDSLITIDKSNNTGVTCTINSSFAGQSTFDVTLTCTPNKSNTAFVSWSGDYKGTNKTLTFSIRTSSSAPKANITLNMKSTLGSATITVNQDGSEYNSGAGNVELYQNGTYSGKSAYITGGHSSCTISSVTAGTYDVYIADKDSGVNVTVSAGSTASVTVNLYTVTIDVKDSSYGTVSAGSVVAFNGTTFSASGATLTFGTYSLFSGSNSVTATPTSATGYTTSFSSWSNTSGTITGARKITANFSRKANTYTVTFNGNGYGTASPTSKTVTYDSTYGDLASISATGYTFDGWYTAASGGTKVTSSTKVTNASNHSLYAHFTAKTYTVSFNSNGGTPCNNITVTYNSTYGTLPTTTRTGYSFSGWYTANSGGTKVTSSTKVTATSNHTLYAYWKVNTYTVSFNSNGGTSCNSITVTYNSTYGTLPTPTRTDYSFAGWYTEASGGTSVTSSTKVTTASDHTLYAHWNLVKAYLHANWQNKVSSLMSTTSIRSITFSTDVPPSYYGSVDVGANSSASTKLEKNFVGTVKAYMGNDHASLTFYSSVTIYAPADCRGLFEGLTALTSFINFNEFNTSNVTDMSLMFNNCNLLTSLNLSNFNTSSVTNMNGMFQGCNSLTSLNLSNFNTSSVTNMSWMFSNCNSLESITFGANFDTSSIDGGMRGMFNECNKITDLDLSKFVTTGVYDVGYMFYNCSALKTLDLSGLIINTFGSFDYMFYGCSSLTELDISSFGILHEGGDDTSDVTEMFTGCTALRTIKTPSSCGLSVTLPNGDWYEVDSNNKITSGPYTTLNSSNTNKTIKLAVYLNKNWKSKVNNNLTSVTEIKFVKGVPDIGYPVGAASSTDTNSYLDTIKIYIRGKTFEFWSTETIFAPADCRSLFEGLTALTKINFNGFNTISATNMRGMFYNCSALTSITFGSGFNTSNVTDMYEMFRGCSLLGSLNLSGFNTSRVTNMYGLFYNCSALTSITFGSNFNTSSVTSMYAMFYECSSLDSLNLSGFNTSQVTNMERMFYNCSALTSITFGSNFNTSNVTTMYLMFGGCEELTSLNLSSFKTSKVTNMQQMFWFCKKLHSITFGNNFSTSSVTTMHLMFLWCESLTELDLSTFTIVDTADVTVDVTLMLTGCTALKTFVAPNTLGKELTLPDSNFVKIKTSLAVNQRTFTNTVGANDDGKTFKVGYTLTADANGGTLIADSGNNWTVASDSLTATKIVLFDETIGNFPTASRDGYSGCSGWNTDPEGVGETYTTNGQLTEETVVYAIWPEPKVYTINFYATSDSVYYTVKILSIKNEYYMPVPPTKGSYLFAGWTADKNSTTATWVMADEAQKATGGKNWYAVWLEEDARTYKEDLTHTFHTSATSSFTVSNTVTHAIGTYHNYNSSVTSAGQDNILKITPVEYQQATKDGYTLAGWAKDGSSTKAFWIRDDGSRSLTQNTTWYAVWYVGGNETYTHTFHTSATSSFTVSNTVTRANAYYNYDCSVSTSSSKVTAGGYVKYQTATRDGYTLDGWAKDGSSTKAFWVIDYGSRSLTQNTTWYAVWKIEGTSTIDETYTHTFYTSAKASFTVTNDKVTTHGTVYENYDGTITRTEESSVEYTKVAYQSATKDGYILVGWTQDSSSREATWKDSERKFKQNTTWYAVWKIENYEYVHHTEFISLFYTDTDTYIQQRSDIDITYTATRYYNYNLSAYADVALKEKSRHYGNLTFPSATRSGYTLYGWATEKNTFTIKGPADTVISVNDGYNVYYAVWGYEVTASYNGNGATSGSTTATTGTAYKTYNLSQTQNASIKLANNGFAKTGYLFNKWAMGSASGTQYAQGATVSLNSNATFYALWTPNTYSITVTVTTNTGDVANLTAQLGSYTSSAVSTTAGANKTTTLTISNVPYGTTGNITLKWAVASGTYYYLISSSVINATQSSSGTASGTYTSIGSYTQGASNGSVSAYFSQLYEMSYNANGGSGAPATQYKVYGVNYTVSTTAPTTALAGFTFVGYATSSSSTTKVTTFTSNANQTFYAIWKKTLSATFYQLDGTTSTLTSDVYNGSTATKFTATTPTVKTSDPFTTIVGWGTSTTATSKTLDSNASSTITSGQNYYAICTYTVTLTYNANGKTLTNTLPKNQTSNRYATASGGSTPNYAGADFTISSTTPTATGYTFSKWNTAQNGSGTNYEVSGSISNATANITLYAVWTINSYKLTVNYKNFVGNTATNITVDGGTGFALNSSTTVTKQYSTTASTVTIATGKAYYVISIGSTSTSSIVPSSINTAEGTNYSYSWTPSSNASIDVYVTEYCTVDFNTSLNGTNVTLTTDIGSAQKSINNGTASTVADSWEAYPWGTAYSFVVSAKSGYVVGKSSSTNASDFSSTVTLSGTATATGHSIDARAHFYTTYTISFDGNTNTGGSTASMSMIYHISKNLTSNGFTKTGYTFAKWTTNSDGTGTEYANGASVNNLTTTAGATVTLYAVWTDNIAPTVTISANATTNCDTFKGTASDAGTGIVGYAFSQSDTTTPTFTAITASSSTTQTFKATAKGSWYFWVKDNAGNTAVSSALAAYSVAITTNNASKSNTQSFAIAGTSYSSDITVTNGYSLPESATSVSNITYSRGSSSTRTITYNLTNITATTKPTSVTYYASASLSQKTVAGDITATITATNVGENVVLKANTGYSLPSAVTVTNATQNYTKSSGALALSTITGNVTITASGVAINYTITIAANGGTGGSVSPSTYSISANDQTATITLPTYDGYFVKDWTISGNTSATIDGTTLTIPKNTIGDILLTAVWELASVDISMQYVLDNYTLGGLSKGGYYGSADTIGDTPNIYLKDGMTWQNAGETTFDSFAGITAFNSAKSYGLITFDYGDSVALTITIDDEYELTALYINGNTINISTIAFSNGTGIYNLGQVKSDTTILAKFARKKITIQLELITQGTGFLSGLVGQGKYSSGVITADGTQIANGTTLTKYYGDSSRFIIMPNAGYVVTSLIQPGESTSVSNPSMKYSIGITYVTSGKLSITLEEQDTWLNYASTETWPTTGKVVITTANQLALLSKKILLGETVPSEIVLGADIDLTGHNWFPIGTSGNAFAQRFDGDSYTISNMTVLNGTAIGLFGYNSGTVYNVKVSGSATGGQTVGGVVGKNTGTVEYVVNGVTATGMSQLGEEENVIGGVVGYNDGNIYASYNTANVAGYYYVGGIAGYNNGTIKNAYNTGAIANNSTSKNASVGGIAGYTTNTNIGYVYNIGSIAHDDRTPYSNFAGNMTLTLPRWYLSASGSEYDTGRALSQQDLQPISTAAFNASTYFANWNSASSNGYKDDIWEINPQDNGGYAYPTFTLQKGFVGTVTITSSFEASAEAGAVAFVTITSTSGNSWKLILYRGAVYTITKLAENETLTITVSSTINHTATTSLDGNTLTLTSESNTITVTIQKASSGAFYAGTVLQEASTQELQINTEDLTYTQEVEIKPEVKEEAEQTQEVQTTEASDETVTKTSQRATQEKLVSDVEIADLQSSKKQYIVLNLNKKRSFAR